MQSIAMHMADGNFAEKAPIWSGDEIGQLGRALNAMALRLEEKIGDLERERAQTRAILDSMTEGVIAVGPEGRILLMNPSAMGIFHLPLRQVEGQPFLEVIRNKELDDLNAGHALKSGYTEGSWP
jgi:signal transduction histidine kinase